MDRSKETTNNGLGSSMMFLIIGFIVVVTLVFGLTYPYSSTITEPLQESLMANDYDEFSSMFSNPKDAATAWYVLRRPGLSIELVNHTTLPLAQLPDGYLPAHIFGFRAKGTKYTELDSTFVVSHSLFGNKIQEHDLLSWGTYQATLFSDGSQFVASLPRYTSTQESYKVDQYCFDILGNMIQNHSYVQQPYVALPLMIPAVTISHCPSISIDEKYALQLVRIHVEVNATKHIVVAALDQNKI